MNAWIILGLNIGAVLLGTLLGCLLKRHVSAAIQENFMDFFAAITVALGVRMLGQCSNFTAVVFAFLLGGVVGHMLQLDRRTRSLAQQMRSEQEGDYTRTLLVSFTLFCTSTAGIQGALELGLTGESSLLTTKSIMDFLCAIFFAASSGWVLALISLPLGILLVGLYLLSSLIAPHLSSEMIGDFSACGGLIQFVNALRLTKLKDPPVLDLIPGLLLVFPISWLWSML